MGAVNGDNRMQAACRMADKRHLLMPIEAIGAAGIERRQLHQIQIGRDGHAWLPR